MTKETRKMRKALLTLCCAALLVCVTIGATVAYLTSTDSVKNTFTVGDVKITLDEAKVDADGKAITGEGAERVQNNTYKLLPGHKYDKDPTVHIGTTSEEAYLRLKVSVTNADATDKLFEGQSATIFGGLEMDKWNVSSTVENDVRTYVFELKETVKGGDADVVLFKTITVPGDVTNDELASIDGTTITVVAEAIQKDGFITANDAWDAFDRNA